MILKHEELLSALVQCADLVRGARGKKMGSVCKWHLSALHYGISRKADTLDPCLFFFLSAVLIRFLSLLQICTQCPGGVHNLSRVAAYCEATSKLIQARCCLNQKGTILG